jgi:hypothetical protein
MSGGSSNRHLLESANPISSLTGFGGSDFSSLELARAFVLPFPAPSLIPLADRVPEWVVKLHTMPRQYIQIVDHRI